MTETNPLNTQLETTDITWNLEDLYSGIDAPEINSDIKWCETEAVGNTRRVLPENGCSGS